MIDMISSLVNPWELSFGLWCLGCITKAILIGILDVLEVGTLHYIRYKQLPSRNPPIMKGLVELERVDWMFLTINQGIEFIFVCHLLLYLWTCPEITWSSMTISNTVLPMYSILMVDDFFYYFAHRIMHMPTFYPLCHKHHHKQALPKRGYLDAANEHPMEQVIALCILWFTLQMVSSFYKQVHVVGVFVFFLLYAASAVLNHTEYDVQFGLVGYCYSVRAHEMHHRFPQCNYVQTFIWWDKLFGTFREYKDNPNIVVDGGKSE